MKNYGISTDSTERTRKQSNHTVLVVTWTTKKSTCALMSLLSQQACFCAQDHWGMLPTGNRAHLRTQETSFRHASSCPMRCLGVLRFQPRGDSVDNRLLFLVHHLGATETWSHKPAMMEPPCGLTIFSQGDRFDRCAPDDPAWCIGANATEDN